MNRRTFLALTTIPPTAKHGRYPSIAVERMLEANALELVTQLTLGLFAAAPVEIAIVRRARKACERAEVLHVSVRFGSLRCHALDDFDDAGAGLPCAAGRSRARKACRKKSRSICCRPTSRSSSAIRAFACVSAERLSS